MLNAVIASIKFLAVALEELRSREAWRVLVGTGSERFTVPESSQTAVRSYDMLTAQTVHAIQESSSQTLGLAHRRLGFSVQVFL